tara:strand:+ start:823 stop:1377 length:555 start_codon:yes stop_codon:yes gene_type:complete
MHKRIKEIEKSLEFSFSKIKEEFIVAHKKVDGHNFDHSKKLDELHGRIANLENLFSSFVSGKSSTENLPLAEPKNKEEEKPHHLNTLTDRQKQLFAEIVGIHIETGSEWLSLVEIAKHSHPGREYKKIRSTLSEYTSVLEEAGLLNKKILRKKAFVRVSTKGIVYVDEDRAKRLKRMMNVVPGD